MDSRPKLTFADRSIIESRIQQGKSFSRIAHSLNKAQINIGQPLTHIYSEHGDKIGKFMQDPFIR